MALLFILLVIAGGMGLSVEAGLLGPLASQVGDLWATMSIFGIGAVLTFFLMLFFSPRSSPSFFSLPGWQLTGGLLGAGYVVILTVATPVIGIAMTMIGILAGQVAKSPAIDHYGLFGSPRRKIDPRRAHGADVDYGGVTAGGSGLRRGNGYDSDHSGTVRRRIA